MNGYSPKDYRDRFFSHSQLVRSRRLHLICSEMEFLRLEEIRDVASNYDGIHVLTNVAEQTLLIESKQIAASSFFQKLDGLGLKFIYLDTCNSVRVISQFRQTDIAALIASTENLYTDYADRFEEAFYDMLGAGRLVSEAYSYAVFAIDRKAMISTRSGRYDPMFLDLKKDFRFSGEK